MRHLLYFILNFPVILHCLSKQSIDAVQFSIDSNNLPSVGGGGGAIHKFGFLIYTDATRIFKQIDPIALPFIKSLSSE